MRSRDLLALALSALYQQKMRTLLTMLGVVFGSFVLVASLALGVGVQDIIVRGYSRHGMLRRIQVYPMYRAGGGQIPEEKLRIKGDLSAARRERLQQQIKKNWQNRHPSGFTGVRLTPQRLEALAALDHVVSLEPEFREECQVFLDGKAQRAFTGAALADNEDLRERLVAGSYFDNDGCQRVLVTEYLLYLLGVVDDAALERVVGKKLRLEFRPRGGPAPRFLLHLLEAPVDDVSVGEEQLLAKVLKRLPAALDKLNLTPAETARLRKLFRAPAKNAKDGVTEEFTIAGVLRAPDDKEAARGDNWRYLYADVILPAATAQELFLRMLPKRDLGLNGAVVTVDHMENVKEVFDKIKVMGLQCHSLVELIEREQFIFLMIFSGMTLVALVALIVSALGIANTMLMSVLERVREIGVMKAVGARNGHIQMIFLVEGALVGLTGGLLGILLGWAASIPGDAWARSLVERRLSIQMEDSIFVFNTWLLIGVPLFACLVTTLAAFYPAWRAARVDPIQALRHD